MATVVSRAGLRSSRLRTQTPVADVFLSARRIKDGNRTCHYDLTLIGHIIEVARKEWGYRIEFNPVRNIKKPTLNPPRTRRLSDQEYRKLESALEHTDVDYLWPLINLAVATAMRKSELLNLKWENISLDDRTIHIPDSKNGSPRIIPISSYAIGVLEGIHRNEGQGVFPTTSSAAYQSWRRLVVRAGIEGLRFHDLRHEAISRFFERGLSIAEVSLISGHKDVKQLFRYTHLRAEDVALKLR
jgi:integrase